MKKQVRLARQLKKWHQWPGAVAALVMVFFSLSGILLNHRSMLGSYDIRASALPTDYHYQNWNRGSLKGNLWLSPDSVLLYGNQGIWLSDSLGTQFTPYVQGMPAGVDNRTVFDLHRTAAGQLFAATQSGLYALDSATAQWQRQQLGPDTHQRIVAVTSRHNRVWVLSRSHLYVAPDTGNNNPFHVYPLQAPQGYNDTIGLFQTLWQVHSGEVFGLPGKLFVDFLGIVMLFLSVSGLIYLLFPGFIRRRKRRRKPFGRLLGMNRFSLRWHNKLGAWLFVFLSITTLTGIFLRPPLLITIAQIQVNELPFTHLEQPNPWHDKLRDLLYDKHTHQLYLSTSEGMYTLAPGKSQPVRCATQPPVSVMGITAFELLDTQRFIVGSFSGLFVWSPATGQVTNLVTLQPYTAPAGRPVGKQAISGLVHNAKGYRFFAEYQQGIQSIHHNKAFIPMPERLAKTARLSLWHLALEIHTGRFFSFALGDFYILLVPLSGLLTLAVLISGYWLWRVRFRRRPRARQ